MRIFKSAKSLSTEELINQLAYSIVLAFCVGFITGVFLTLTVFVVETSDYYKNVFVPIFVITFLLGFWWFIKYLRDNVIPEFRKRCKY